MRPKYKVERKVLDAHKSNRRIESAIRSIRKRIFKNKLSSFEEKK